MRSQQEILNHIKKIQSSGVDPSGLQQKVLIHKLSWENALPFLGKKDAETQQYWLQHCLMDREVLVKEIEEQVDYTFMLMANKDLKGIFISLQIIMVKIWLLGHWKEQFLSHYVPEVFSFAKDYGRSIMKMVCEEFGFDINTYYMRYLGTTESGLIIPGRGVRPRK